VQLHGRGTISEQDVGFLQLDDYPLLLKRNLWQHKRWGREELWRKVLSLRPVANSRSALSTASKRKLAESVQSTRSSTSRRSSNQVESTEDDASSAFSDASDDAREEASEGGDVQSESSCGSSSVHQRSSVT